jgi:hypothetical protein
METRRTLILLAAVVFPFTAHPQSPSPQPTQAQPIPCVTTSTPNPSGNNIHVKVPNKWQQALSKRLGKIEEQTGIDVAGVATDMQQVAKAKPAPCLPQGAPSKNPPPALPPALKLPPDTTVTLHCNPMTPSAKDVNGHPTTLTLPDPHDYAPPKPTDFEFDSVVPDLAAKTPCYLVKVDPKSNKSFVTQ